MRTRRSRVKPQKKGKKEEYLAMFPLVHFSSPSVRGNHDESRAVSRKNDQVRHINKGKTYKLVTVGICMLVENNAAI